MPKKHNNKTPEPPENASYEELDDYYTQHDTESLLKAGIFEEASHEEYKELKENLGTRPKKAQVNFRLNEEELALLKKIAKYRAIPYGTLARSWVVERLRSELKSIET